MLAIEKMRTIIWVRQQIIIWVSRGIGVRPSWHEGCRGYQKRFSGIIDQERALWSHQMITQTRWMLIGKIDEEAKLFNLEEGRRQIMMDIDPVSRGISIHPSWHTGCRDYKKRISGTIDQAMAIHFSEVILMDILSRLPVKSLLRFKCVSKFWEKLISDPYLKMKHLNRAKNDQDSQKLLTSLRCRNNGICSMYCCPLSPVQLVEDVQKLDFPSNPTPFPCIIHCCYDGLAVMEVSGNLNEDTTFLLWNPSTRESIELPSPEFRLNKSSCFGLGYDSTSGEYKIVQIFQHMDLPCEIFVLKGGSWKRSVKHPHGIYSLMFAVQFLTFAHAAFHWIGMSRNHAVMVSFSILNEVHGEIPLPEEISVSDVIGITLLDGMLSLHSNRPCDQSNSTIKLWVLKEYGIKKSWIPFLSIEDPYIVYAMPKYRFPDGEVLFMCFVEGSLRTRSGPFGAWPEGHTLLEAHAFTESLISPRSPVFGVQCHL